MSEVVKAYLWSKFGKNYNMSDQYAADISNFYFNPGAVDENKPGECLYFYALYYISVNNIEKYLQTMKLAHDKNYLEATINLAFYYKFKNMLKESREYFLRATEKSDGLAMYELANMSDEDGFLYWHKQAIKAGYGRSADILGTHYAYNIPLYEKYKLLAIKLGHLSSYFDIVAHYYRTGQLQKFHEFYIKSLDAKISSVHIIMSDYYMDLGDIQSAIETYMLIYDPKNPKHLKKIFEKFSGNKNNLSILYKKISALIAKNE